MREMNIRSSQNSGQTKIAELAEMTVAETGMGNVADKIEKLKLAVEKHRDGGSDHRGEHRRSWNDTL